jgi:hypothetical protein
VPEQVVEKAFEFSSYLETLWQGHPVRLNAEDQATLEASILTGLLPTLRSSATTITSAGQRL